MSSPSDPPPSSDGPPQPMTIPAALGWTIAATLGFTLLQIVMLKLRPASTYDLVSHVGCQAIAYLTVFFLILRVHAPEAPIRDFLGLRGTHFAFYPLAILLGLSVWLPAEVVAEVIQSRWPLSKDEFGEVFRAASPAARAGMIVAMAALGPLLEEIFFRGALFRALRKTQGEWAVIAATAAMFALVHAAWQVLIPIGLLGVLLGFVRARSGSLVPSVLVHGCFNGVSCALMAFTKSTADERELSVPDAVVVGSLVVAALVVAAIHLLGARSAAAARARELDAA